MAGLVQFIGNGAHRKELVAGNMAEYTTAGTPQNAFNALLAYVLTLVSL